jgi:hypothetical protein
VDDEVVVVEGLFAGVAFAVEVVHAGDFDGDFLFGM